MMPLFALLVLFVGGFNWLSIGLLQYDFIAGFFGTQASIFSRLLYILVGVATFYLIFDLVRNKGKIIIQSNKKRMQTNYKQQNEQPAPQYQIIETRQNDSNNNSNNNNNNDILAD